MLESINASLKPLPEFKKGKAADYRCSLLKEPLVFVSWPEVKEALKLKAFCPRFLSEEQKTGTGGGSVIIKILTFPVPGSEVKVTISITSGVGWHEWVEGEDLERALNELGLPHSIPIPEPIIRVPESVTRFVWCDLAPSQATGEAWSMGVSAMQGTVLMTVSEAKEALQVFLTDFEKVGVTV